MNINKSKKYLGISVLSGFLLAIFIACSNIMAQEAKPQSTGKTGDFARGAQIWAETCVRCHNMRRPDEKNDARWNLVMTHMRTRAGLTGQDTRDVLAFLQASNG